MALTTTTSKPGIILSAFADEGAASKAVVEQFAVLAALGLQYYSPRFLNISGQVKNIMALDKAELKQLRSMQADYGLRVATIGSPIGKVKLRDVDDGSHNRFVPFRKYLAEDVATAIDRAAALETKLIRGFSFYPPKGGDPRTHLSQAAEQLAAIVEKCAAAGVVFGLEVEANLVGQSGVLLADLARRVNHPNIVCIFDGGNLSCQNKTAVDCLDEFHAMSRYFGWMHIKDYRIDPDMPWTGAVDEDRLKNFVPADVGDSGHEAILRSLAAMLPAVERKMKKLGAPGVFLELEPHLKGGGQFGGFSGPDGVGVACRALCRLLDYVGIDYHLRDFRDIQAARGF
jgi:sugar phosphate isomerase/epimerase